MNVQKREGSRSYVSGKAFISLDCEMEGLDSMMELEVDFSSASALGFRNQEFKLCTLGGILVNNAHQVRYVPRSGLAEELRETSSLDLSWSSPGGEEEEMLQSEVSRQNIVCKKKTPLLFVVGNSYYISVLGIAIGVHRK